MNDISHLEKLVNYKTNKLVSVTATDVAGAEKKKSLLEKIGSYVADVIDFKVPTTSSFITEDQKNSVKNLLQSGDVLLSTDNEYPIFQLIEKATLGTDWTHMAMYMGEGKIAESTTNGEKFSANKSLDKYLNTYHVAVVRPNYKTEADKNFALQYMKDAEGRLYDPYYDTSDESMLYCSEAAYHAFRKMPNPINLPLTHTFGRDIASPDAVLNNPNTKLIYSSNSNYWKNQLTHYPLGVGVAAGAGGLSYLGARIGHPIALGVAGAACGLAVAWGAMKIIWPSLDYKVNGY